MHLCLLFTFLHEQLPQGIQIRSIFCKIKMTMGNASDDVKPYADYVTAHIDDDGVAKALDRFIPCG